LQPGTHRGTVHSLHAERFARHEDAKFDQLFECLPAGVYTCDAEGLITYFNPRAQDIWGRAPALNDRADRYCGSFRLFASDGAPIKHEDCWMALALRNGRAYSGEEIRIERPDGDRRTVLAHAHPFYNESGALLGAVNVLVDITGRARDEQLLKDAEQSKNEFLATLAHELRNPLAPLRNAVEYLQIRNPPTPEVRWAFDIVDRQLRQLTRLVDDLLDVARITNNRLELRKEPADLVAVLRTAIETARPLIDAADLRFVVSLPPAPVGLMVDSARIAQVIANLLNNAAKYSRPGGSVWLMAKTEGTEAVISIRDDGVGIDAGQLAGLFDMFSPAGGGHGSLGVGLTLAQRLTEMHGGSMSAHSDGPGAGAEFTLRLPLAEPPPTTGAKPEPVRGLGDVRLRILVVDDNRDTADSLQMLLHVMRHEIRTAYDGLEAVRCAQAFEPDVVFLDIGLPKMSGYEVAQTLRRQQGERRLTLIAISGWGQEADRKRSQEAGFDRHLVKPVDPAEIFGLLHALQAKTPRT
jgi:PAS domain S-box-containing protein